MRRVPFIAALLGVAIVALGSVQLGTGAQTGTPSTAGPGFVGAWRVTVSPPQGQPHPGLLTFAADGTLMVADLPVQPAPPGLPVTTLFFSGGHGVWEATGQGAGFTFDVLVAADTGGPLGTLTLRGTAVLGPDGQTLDATYTVAFADPTGQVMTTGQGSFKGTRIRVESQGTPVAGTPTT